MNVTQCPSCGSRRIQHVCRDFHGELKGEAYVVPDLEFHECSDCGEKLFDRDAMRRIEEVSPAYREPRSHARAGRR